LQPVQTVLIQVGKKGFDIIEPFLCCCVSGEFATQTCFLGRYGQEIGSDQFGATIMASSSTGSSTGIQQAILRLSNIEVNDSICIKYLLYDFIFLGVLWWSSFSSWSISSSFSYEWKYESILYQIIFDSSNIQSSC
jgi:hypothetical protein